MYEPGTVFQLGPRTWKICFLCFQSPSYVKRNRIYFFFGSNIRIPMILSQNNVTYLHRSESTSTASENTNRWCFQPCYCSKKKTVPRITCFLKIVYDNIQNMPYFLMLISFQIPTSCISIYLFWIFDQSHQHIEAMAYQCTHQISWTSLQLLQPLS